MPLPLVAEILQDVRRVLGADVSMRSTWTGQESTVFQVLREDRVAAYLKVAPGLSEERARLQWLEGRLPVPGVLSFGECEATDWLVMTALPGLDLTNIKHTEAPGRIVELLAAALRGIHAIPTDGCPFGEPLPDAVATHGDACLPNFLFVGDRMSGVLDVGAFGLGDFGLDLATAVWSIGFNLGPGHAKLFLDAYGLDLATSELELVIDADGNEALQRRHADVG
jgi:aminoglycoside phosphotransferase